MHLALPPHFILTGGPGAKRGRHVDRFIEPTLHVIDPAVVLFTMMLKTSVRVLSSVGKAYASAPLLVQANGPDRVGLVASVCVRVRAYVWMPLPSCKDSLISPSEKKLER